MKQTKIQQPSLTQSLVLLGLATFFHAGCASKSKAGPVATGSPQASYAAVAQDERPTDALSVQTVVPSRKDLVVKFEQPSPVEAVAKADLYSRATGYVKKVHVDIGDTVKAEQVLLEVDVPDVREELSYKEALVRQSQAEREQAETAIAGAQAALDALPAELAKAQADVEKAKAEKRFAEQQVTRYAALAANDAETKEVVAEKRAKLGAAEAAYDASIANHAAVEAQRAILQAKLDAAKADQHTKETKIDVAKADRERARAALEFARVRAPFDGVITRRHSDEGAFVSSAASGRGEPIFTIARIDRLLAVLRVPEKEVTSVRVGCRAHVRLDSQEIEGTVARFSPSLDEKSRAMRVEIEIDNGSRSLYPGMYGPCKLILKEISNALTVPASAVYAREGQAFVIQVQNGKAHRIAVKTGYDDGHVVEILDGLQDDEEIAVSNKGQIAEGQTLDPHRIDEATDDSVANSSANKPHAN